MEDYSDIELERLSNISMDAASSVLETSIKLRGTSDFKATMQDVIIDIRDMCEAEHCCVFVINKNTRGCYVLCEAFSKDTKLLPMETYVNDDFYDIADSWETTMAGSNCILVKNDKDFEKLKKRNPIWVESIQSAGGKNIIMFPLRSRNELHGYIWAINFDVSRAKKIKETLELTTFIMGSELGNYILLERLKENSSKDMLTGVMNRNQMNMFVDRLSRGLEGDSTLGVIFADMNGLKAVNDSEGHGTGDVMLKKAAGVLKSIFDVKYIFRAGGDEFAIIIPGITEKELNEKIERIHKECANYDKLSFSVGGSFERKCGNVRIALRHADENMYDNKRRLYENIEKALGDERLNVPLKKAEFEEREQNLIREMNYDSLTGLPSMSFFFKLAEAGRNRMYEQEIPSAVVFINLKDLRFYNQKYGFIEGDTLIRSLAKLLDEEFGADNCSRFGQDHFAVFAEAEDLEKKLKTVFKEMKKANGGRSLPVRAGIYPDTMGLVETSLACDRAKYACKSIKNDRGSCFKYFDEKMLKWEINRQYVIENLDRALSEDWITAYYQPIVRSTNRKVCDEEALARWIDPDKGMLSPADFIPILEDARLIYKVDLHIVDVILERIKKQIASGKMNVVPISVNLSRTDFDSCDIVDEIWNRVKKAGVSPELITIEITESVVGKDFEYMKEQINRFKKLGFSVWMDDFGSGYSSLELLRELDFDLIKFDMRFMRQFDSTPKSRVLLTELMRMAISLNFETVCEGVETIEQVEFLGQIGCTKMQGYYFCKPISFEQILDRYKKGSQIGFENPDESYYQKTISAINLYDLGALSNDENESVRHYFNTLPMAIFEYDGKEMNMIRSNKSYNEFLEAYRNVSNVFPDYIHECKDQGQKVLVNEVTDDGELVNALVKHLLDNPINGKGAYAIAILEVTPIGGQNITYTGIAKALSADYIDMYHVDLKTDKFTHYSSGAGDANMAFERRGDDFFNESSKDAVDYIHKDDLEEFLIIFTKEHVLKAINEYGSFTHTYRLLINGNYQYVNMKAVPLDKNRNQLVIGVNNVDAQMRSQEAYDKLKEEASVYTKISALLGNVIALYMVDPETDSFMQYTASSDYSQLGASVSGSDFFDASLKKADDAIDPDDYEYFVSEFKKENILRNTNDGKVFIMNYGLKIGNGVVKVTLRAGMVNEKGRSQLIVGIYEANQ